MFTLTEDGRTCLAHFFSRIPIRTRQEITVFINHNRLNYKKSQEYFSDYFKNSDGTHTVVLRIKEQQAADLLEIRIKAPTRSSAIRATTKWKDKAAQTYEWVHNTFVED